MTQIAAFLILVPIMALSEDIPIGDAWEALCDLGGGTWQQAGIEWECVGELPRPEQGPAK